ncbi:MAG: bifunctional phosphoribosyl-AMP cyclohydrolase/phosphoribosyl-ATP diphosphatase HisIE [Nitrospirota bacterium]
MTQVKFDEKGLVPAVVQDWRDGTVLMLGYMNREALARTMETGSVHFWSRSRNRLWEKGETSGHKLVLKEVFLDCDGDTLLVKAEPVGPTCHTGERACFFTKMTAGAPEPRTAAEAAGGILERLYQTVLDRKRSPTAGSYVSSLLQGGADKVLKKVVEEAGEVALAAKGGKREEIVYEAADLLFHTLVALGYHDVTPQEVYQELASRFGKSGLRAKTIAAGTGPSGRERRAGRERRGSRDRRSAQGQRSGAERRKGPDRRQSRERRGRRA